MINEYKKLLAEGETILKLPADVLVDFRDYLYMTSRNLPHGNKWLKIRSYHVTSHYRTLWQLSEQYLDSDFRPIGVLEPPTSLIRWIIDPKNIYSRIEKLASIVEKAMENMINGKNVELNTYRYNLLIEELEKELKMDLKIDSEVLQVSKFMRQTIGNMLSKHRYERFVKPKFNYYY